MSEWETIRLYENGSTGEFIVLEIVGEYKTLDVIIYYSVAVVAYSNFKFIRELYVPLWK